MLIIITVYFVAFYTYTLEPFENKQAQQAQQGTNLNQDVINFVGKIKADLDLDVNNINSLNNNFVPTATIHYLKSLKLNKPLISFDSDDVYNTIANAYTNKFNIDDANTYYRNYLNEYKSVHRQYVYEKLGTFLRDKKKKNIRNIQQLQRSLTPAERQGYDGFLNTFYRDHLYNNISINIQHPFHGLKDQSFKTYIASLTTGDATKEHYEAVKNYILGKINTNSISYDNPQEFMIRLLKALHIMSLIDVHINEFITELLQNDGKCFIQNNGDMNVNMRTCGIYFVPQRNMCDMFENIYRLSNFQLQVLLNKAPVQKEYKIGNITKKVNVFDKKILEIINANKKGDLINKSLNQVDIKNDNIKTAFITVLKQIFGENVITSNQPKANDMIKSIILEIYTMKMRFNTKEYHILDLYRIHDQKLKHKIQLCKISLPELKEIASETTYTRQRESKVSGYQTANPIELWGSCFYSLNNNQMNEYSTRMITNDMKMKYNIISSCDDNVIENIKCKSGCTGNNQDKYLAFNTSTFRHDTKMILNPSLNIPNNLIFMKIAPNLQNARFTISFVIFDNISKQFITTSNMTYLNQVIRDKIFTIKQTANGFSIGPNRTKKRVYACYFYNGILYSYHTRDVDFSLADHLGIKNIDIGHNTMYANVRAHIHLLSAISACNQVSTYNNDYNKMKDCLNNIKNMLNAHVLQMLTNVLNSHLNNKRYYEDVIRGVDANLSRVQGDYQANCDAPHQKNLMNIYVSTINAYDRQISQMRGILSQQENDKYYWENTYQARWWLPWEWIHKIKMINDKKREIEGTNNEIRSLEASRNRTQTLYDQLFGKCNQLTNEANRLNENKRANQNHINTHITPKVSEAQHNVNKYHIQDPQYFYQNIETYHINNINFVNTIYSYNNKGILTQAFMKDFLIKLYDENFISSNDDAIYIQIN